MKTTATIIALYASLGAIVIYMATSCASTKQYHSCDAYKVNYPKIKADKHKHHGLCDAYN